MRRRKLGTTVQVNLRIREELRRQLEAAAKEHHLSFNQECTARLVDSFQAELRQSYFEAAEKVMALIREAIAEGRLLPRSKVQAPRQKQEEAALRNKTKSKAKSTQQE
jgi:hypothetical protein